MIYPKVTTWDVFKEYWKSARNYKVQGTLVVLGTIAFIIANIVIAPLYYKKFFDVLASTQDPHTTAPQLFAMILVIAGIHVVAWVCQRTADFLSNYFNALNMNDLRMRAYDYVLEHSFSFFTHNFTGALVQRINRFVKVFQRLSDIIFSDLVALVIRVAGTGIVLYFVQPRIAYAMYIWIFLFLAFSYGVTRIKLKYDIAAAAMDSKITGMMADVLSNHNSIQLFTSATSESDQLKKINRNLTNISIKRWNIGSFADAIQSFLTFGIEFFIFYYAIRYWEAGVVSIGTFALIQSYILYLNTSLWGFGRIVRDLYEGVADAKEMIVIFKTPHEIQNIPGAQILSVSQGAIEFKNVTFAFDQNKPILKNFNLSIQAGEKVALIGHSGAGKSTLVKLLLRLHDIKHGEILVDGQNIAEVTQNSLRENISLVPQDPALFHRTLMENIRYGKRNATTEEVVEASKLAHCDIFIKEFPQKYETFVGERGIKLSGGERQRVAIARALLKNAPILVLDEATSSLDSHSESLIQDALATLMKGKTTLVIAHRLSTIRKMDRIIVLGKEGIVEQGSHDELIRNNGTYARLWHLQAGGFANKSIEDLLDDENK